MRFYPLFFLLAPPAAVAAQASTPLALLDDWKHQRTHILAVIDSAGGSMLEFRSTPGVRTFAEQIDHIVTVAAVIVGRLVVAKPMPDDASGVDSASYLHDHAKLRAKAERYLGFVIESLTTVSEAELGREQAFAGGSMPRWRWNMTALQHSAWTLGQLVPYLRMNGKTPPPFTPF